MLSMAGICLPKTQREKLSKALRERDVSLTKLYEMTSEERNALLSHYVGKTFATRVNAEFEKAMLSNQKKALANWVGKATSYSEPIRRDLLKRVERLEKALTKDEERGFLKDLVDTKLGMNLTEEEAQQILTMKKTVDELRAKIPQGYANTDDVVLTKDMPDEALAFGYAMDDFIQLTQGMKREAEALTLKERFLPKNYGTNVVDAAGVAKSLKATFDDSFIGRQGIKLLLRGNYVQWGKGLLESIRLFGKELVAKSNGFFAEADDSVMRTLRAEIYARPNFLNGKYRAAKNGYALEPVKSVAGEEAFPSALPERIPLLGRIFKASQTAFQGTAMQLRANLADTLIAQAERNGVDMLDEAQATALGNLVGALTGRAELGATAPIGHKLNVLMFAPRFLRSNFDTITAHTFDKRMTPEIRKMAIMSTLRIAANLTALLTTAKLLGADVELDPRSPKFGTIGVGRWSYDVTGGMKGILTAGSRIFPFSSHNGEIGFWSKSGTTGKYTKMTGENFGEQTAENVLINFFSGKLAPGPGVIRDILRQRTFSGEKPDFVNTVIGLTVPISAEMLIEELQKGNDDIFWAMAAETFGFSPQTNTFMGSGKRWNQLRSDKGVEVQNNALKEVTRRFNERADKLQQNPRWDKETNEEQSKELDKIRQEETDRVLNRYGL